MLGEMLRGSRLVINGYNGNLTTTFEELADMSALLVVQVSAGLAIKVGASSASDTSAGTGARTIRLYGLSPTGTFQTEDIILNGNTTVASLKTWGIASGFPILGAEVLTTGTGLANAGTIDVADNAVTFTAGVSQDLTKTYARITTGHNMSHNGFFQVPKGERYCLTCLNISNRAQIEDTYISWGLAGAAKAYMPVSLMPATAPYAELNVPRNTILLPENYIFRMSGITTAGGIMCGTAFLDKLVQAN